MYVTRNINGQVNATYDINQKTKSSIVLNGSFNMYVKKETTFTDPGVVAKSSNGAAVTATITGTVNTNTLGNYVLTYTHGETSITRNVIVYE